MNAPRTITIIVVSLLLLSSGATVAVGDHGSDIFDWIDDAAEDDDYYGIEGNAYPHFSGDAEQIDADDVYNSTNSYFNKDMNNETAERAFYEVGDYTFDDPQVAVLKWNNQNRYEFNSGGRSKTVYPKERVHRDEFRDGENGRLKDAYIRFYAIDPSTTVHVKPSDSADGDVTEYRIGKTVNIGFLQSARTEAPAQGLFNGILDKKKRVNVEEYGVEYTRLYSSNCGDGESCKVAETTNSGPHVQMRNVNLPAEGQQTLRVESKYTVRYEVTNFTRNWMCDPVELPKIDLDGDGKKESQERGDQPDEGRDGGAPGWDCYWTDWEEQDSFYPEDEVTIEDEMYVTVESPEVTATKANLPSGYESYHFEGLDRAEWSRITFGSNGDENIGIRSAWRYFGSRDQRFDVYCEKDGNAPSGAQFGDPCGNYDHDRKHHGGTSARPLLNHAIPSPYGVRSYGSGTEIVATPESVGYPYPHVRRHKTCQGSCEWLFTMYQPVDMQNDTYSEPRSLVVRRSSETDYVRVWGLVGGNAQDVEITNERDVHLAKIEYEAQLDGSSVPDGLREGPNADNLPGQNEAQVTVTLYDAETGEPIDLTERTQEYVKITDGVNTYRMKPGADGTVTVNLRKSKAAYQFTYEHRDWWNVPSDQQAYVTEGALYKDPSQSFTTRGALYELFRFGVILAIPTVLMLYILRAAGYSVTLGDFWKIIRREWLP